MDTKALQAQARQQRLINRAAVRETLETQRRAAAEAKLRRQRITVGMVIVFCSSSLVLMYVLFFRPVCGKMNVPVRTAQVWMKLTTGRTFRIVCDQTFLSRAWEMLEMAEEP